VIKPQIQIPYYNTTTPLILSSFFLEIAYVHMKPCLNPDLQNFVELWNASHLKLTGTSAGPILYSCEKTTLPLVCVSSPSHSPTTLPHGHFHRDRLASPSDLEHFG